MEEDASNEDGQQEEIRRHYLQLRKDLWFLSKSARLSTSVSNVSGNSFLKNENNLKTQLHNEL